MGKPEISVIKEPGFQTFSKNQLELREEELNQNHKQRIARDLEVKMSKQVTLKVYYVDNNATKEIRKFAIDEDLVGNFEYLIGKIRVVFPDLLRKDLQLFWKGKMILQLLFASSHVVFVVLLCVVNFKSSHQR